MTNEEIIEQLENAIKLIRQDGKDWFDDRDIPILEACIKSLTAIDKIKEEIASSNGKWWMGYEAMIKEAEVFRIIDKYR